MAKTTKKRKKPAPKSSPEPEYDLGTNEGLIQAARAECEGYLKFVSAKRLEAEERRNILIQKVKKLKAAAESQRVKLSESLKDLEAKAKEKSEAIERENSVLEDLAVQKESLEHELEALKETKNPATLEEIVGILRSGGIRIGNNIINRAVNAALMRTTGIEKTDDGKYVYKEEEDIPF